MAAVCYHSSFLQVLSTWNSSVQWLQSLVTGSRAPSSFRHGFHLSQISQCNKPCLTIVTHMQIHIHIQVFQHLLSFNVCLALSNLLFLFVHWFWYRIFVTGFSQARCHSCLNKLKRTSTDANQGKSHPQTSTSFQYWIYCWTNLWKQNEVLLFMPTFQHDST